MTNKKEPLRPRRTGLSRRQFLLHSAGVAGASIGLGVGANKASPEIGGGRIRLGFVGTGQRGMQLLSAALEVPDVEIVALADPDPARRSRARERCRPASPEVFRAMEPLLHLAGRGRLDAVIVATPPYLHRDHATAALQAGLHVYLEKPLALSVADCAEVLREAETAQERGQVFQIGFQRRYNPRYLASLNAIHRGEAGTVRFLRAQWHNQGTPSRGKSWYFQRDKSGDLVLEHACHQIDVFNWVFESVPSRACGFGGAPGSGSTRADPSIRDHYGLMLEYPGGSQVLLSQLAFAMPDRRFTGVYELAFGDRLGVDLGNAIAWDRGGKAIELCHEGGSDTRLAVRAFASHVRMGQVPRANARVGYRATVAALLGLRALDSGRVVSWEEIAGGGQT